MPLQTLRAGPGLYPALELHFERKLRVRDLPGIAVLQPFLGLLDLVAVFDVLFENPEIISKAIADCGKIQGGNRIQEAGGEPPEPAIAEARFDLEFPEILPLEPLFRHGRAADVFHLKIDDIVAHHATNQELK